MRKRKAIILPLVLLCSCELVVDVKMPQTPRRLTLNSVFQPDSTWQAQVFKSNGVLDEFPYGFEPVADASVTIHADDGAITTLPSFSMGVYRAKNQEKPVTGKIYSIEVSAPGFETVRSRGGVPNSTRITSAVIEERTPAMSNNFNNFIVDVTFEDDPSTENFYEIELYKEVKYAQPGTSDTIRSISHINLQLDEASISQAYSERLLVDDLKRQGNEISIRASGYDSFYESDDSEYVLSVVSLSKELHDYFLTSTLQYQTSGDPFAQPVHVTNNIENGFGIFGGANAASLRFKR